MAACLILCASSVWAASPAGSPGAADLAPGWQALDTASSQPVPQTPGNSAPATDDASPAETDATDPPADAEAADDRFAPITEGKSFDIRIEAPDDIAKFVERYLELKRYQKVSDISLPELRDLLALSETQIRQLLGTRGLFTPVITQQLEEAPADGSALPQVVITIDPGQQAQVSSVDLQFSGPVTDYAPAQSQLAQARDLWTLQEGEGFTQDAWSKSKSQTLRGLQAERFPTARLDSSRAEIDPDHSTAKLQALYVSGPLYRYGPLTIEGTQRYDPVIIERLAQVRTGEDYRQQDLLEAQERLLDSGYYDSAIVTLDTRPESDPDNAPVNVSVREARLKKLVLGVGFSTDRGPRTSVDFTHNKDPLLGLRSVSRLQLDQKLQAFSSNLMSIPDEKLWRWTGGVNVVREDLDDRIQRTEQLKFGRAKAGRSIDRSYYLQYDHSKTTYETGDPVSAQALSGHYTWTYRRFNSTTRPTGGFGIGLEAGAGMTVQPTQEPFGRLVGRYLGFLSLDRPIGQAFSEALPSGSQIKAAAVGDAPAIADAPLVVAPTAETYARRRNGELVVRLDAGGVFARDGLVIPHNLMFLAGGNATVRGYGYQELGITNDEGYTDPGRFLLAGSLEYRRPWLRDGEPTDFDIVTFVDAGTVANKASELSKVKVGVGAGMLWNSPVGPVQAALAYGVDAKQFRLHLNLGFNF
ncbi:BamA/TamA family outer membrane protein [Brachymonas sp. G13]|uniref:autotransporter assembly complex protein TamA n=1 Tax=Brachymonas TaxID=28219 RepID=UPI002E784789|nr:BamA/TamA family outer membrane protein [Brachymonas sp. J145]MEE1652894.1 BamA/TamA family outer membrane protein [Brachymonas sp. J145]